jgi:general stress protein YciG
MRDTNAVEEMSTSMPNTAEPGPASTSSTKKKRGFAAMDREQVRELARRGGSAAHRAGTAHEFSTEEARAAGRKGGLAAHASKETAPVRAPEDAN